MQTLAFKASDSGLPDIAEELRALLEASDEGIVPVVERVLSRAVEHRASDIHLEPWAEGLAVRFRIDGTLHDIATLPTIAQQRITSRIKVLARMPVYEKHTPQDGRIEIDGGPVTKALRVSTFPTVHGEKVVLRVLSGRDELRGLDRLGFSSDLVHGLRDLIAMPQGVLLLTGPSSSGKTTTIYALLNALMNDAERARHIVTIEDPVECRLGRIAQTQIAPHGSVTFVTALRSLLRQDPDVIMVGEIRDADTARATIQAGLTGHLVFTTIHSGSAAGVFGRLLDMGVEPYLMASAITGVLAQRLVRLTCQQCSERYEPSPDLLSRFGATEPSGGFRRGAGCPACHGIGYIGRAAIGELLRVRSGLADALSDRVPTSRIQELAVGTEMTPLLDDALDKVRQGQTTLDELQYVLPPRETT